MMHCSELPPSLRTGRQYPPPEVFLRHHKEGEKYKRTLSLCECIPKATQHSVTTELENNDKRSETQRHQGAEDEAAQPHGVSQARSQTPRHQGAEQWHRAPKGAPPRP